MYEAKVLTEEEYYAAAKKTLQKRKRKMSFGNTTPTPLGQILSFEKSQGEKWISGQEKTQSDYLNSFKAKIKSTVSESESAFNKILSAQESFQSKLFDTI